MDARRPKSESWSVMIGFTISALVHLLVVLPLMVAIMTTRQAPQVMTARFDPESFREENPRQELQLGIEARTDARMTWIGYEEYQEHLAQLAEFEQAAFSESPGAAPSEPTPTAAPSNPTPNDPVDPATEGQPTDQPTPGDIPAEAQVASNEFTEPGPGDLEPETPGGNAATPQVEPLRDEQAQQVKPPESASSAASTDDLGGRSEPSAEMTTTSTPAGIETIRSLVDEVTAVMIQAQAMTPNETTPSPPSEAAEPSVASPPGAGSGDPSDKDADPSSTVEVPLDELKRGKPLAAHGLELKPRRPDFALLTLLTASPGNPLVEIRFKADGRPLEALIVESSGDLRVDVSIRSSLYRWRASGEPLSQLKGEETISVVIRIVLTRR